MDTISSLTVRLVRSFEYRTSKNLILHNVSSSLTLRAFIELIQQEIKKQSGFKVYQNNTFDTLKIFTKPFGSKTSNLIINLDHEEWIMSDLDQTLKEYGIENEYEISFFNRTLYEEYKKNPQVKW